MVKVTGPAFSLASSPPLRKKRKPYGAAALPSPEPPPPPVPEHVIVTAGDPAPDPDCTGTYNYEGINNERHYFKRTTEPFYYLIYHAGPAVWKIGLDCWEYYPETDWHSGDDPPGEWPNEAEPPTIAVVSEVIPETP